MFSALLVKVTVSGHVTVRGAVSCAEVVALPTAALLATLSLGEAEVMQSDTPQ